MFAPWVGQTHTAARSALPCYLKLAETEVLPAPPAGEPLVYRPGVLAYYLRNGKFVAHFPGRAQLWVDPNKLKVTGWLATDRLELEGYALFEDMVTVGLAPLLRRRGLFMLHAFAAVWRGQAVLLVGSIGSGKTTSGISLLRVGWRLLANDTPLVSDRDGVLQVYAYPGLLSVHPNVLHRFPELHQFLADASAGRHTRKPTFSAETVYPGIWAGTAPLKLLCFLEIVPGLATCGLLPMRTGTAFRELLPHSLEMWDRDTVPASLELLTKVAETVPAYRLCLGESVDTLSSLLQSRLANPTE
ncbi:MAG TPA: hypothetical protein EYP04_04090 [Anaerolineae bacterium]|nr:hypothetical protein [Anaerolineae bacterium]HIQ04813.1 hypothetical protein [Anaerolineae bacterium]